MAISNSRSGPTVEYLINKVDMLSRQVDSLVQMVAQLRTDNETVRDYPINRESVQTSGEDNLNEIMTSRKIVPEFSVPSFSFPPEPEEKVVSEVETFNDGDT